MQLRFHVRSRFIGGYQLCKGRVTLLVAQHQSLYLRIMIIDIRRGRAYLCSVTTS